MLMSSDGDLLDLCRLAAEGKGDCDGSMGRGAGSARGVVMNEGVDWLIWTEDGGGSLCIEGLVFLLLASKLLAPESWESTWSILDRRANSC